MNKTICDFCYKDCDANVYGLNIKLSTSSRNTYDALALETRSKDVCFSCVEAINELLLGLSRK